ncbi:probable potassium transporter 17 [Malania oleifera]|uniref:probable potassium transporter 17 n=1 Tax=Malania oleifera TaxID=397392 RepID=UPI0025AE3836|nr:probable potassium transporter 17 [Malania oleifera]
MATDRQPAGNDYGRRLPVFFVDATHNAHLGLSHNPNKSLLSSSYHKCMCWWGSLLLGYKTLGVVFGGLVTSPLYVYPSMRLKSPTEDDYLGIYSIMFWTLTLIGVVKYTGIALEANHHGKGRTFALYSLLCRNLNMGILSSESVNSNFSLSHSVPDEGSKNQGRLWKYF